MDGPSVLPEHGRHASALVRSGAVSGFLSFLVPGLGQVAAGAWLRGAVIALPLVVLGLGLTVVWYVDRVVLFRVVLNPTSLAWIVAMSIGLLLYRLWAIRDAWRIGAAAAGGDRRPPARRAASLGVLVVLLAATLVMHGYVASVGLAAHETLLAVFDPAGPRGRGDPPVPSRTPESTPTPKPTPRALLAEPIADPTPDPTRTRAPMPTPTPAPTPAPTPTPEWAADGRLNVLLVGSDAGPGRWSQRADAIILISVDIATGRIAAFSVPRYTYNVPLPEPAASAFACRCLAEPINALFVFAQENPGLFAGDGELKGWMALSGAIERLFGITVDGMAVADLIGFVRLVDAVGGVTVNVESPVYDEAYPDLDGATYVEVYFPPGEQRMDGWHALAYARTRHQDGDVARMNRQQTVVRALARELSCNALFNLPGILQVARETLWTNLSLDDVPDMIGIDLGPLESHILFDVHNPSLDAAEILRVQGEVANAFAGAPSAEAQPAGTSSAGC